MILARLGDWVLDIRDSKIRRFVIRGLGDSEFGAIAPPNCRIPGPRITDSPCIGLLTEKRIGRLSKRMILHMADVPDKVMRYTE